MVIVLTFHILIYLHFQNEETFFRQFVSGFVSIWDKQLNLSFDDPPLWSSRKNDLGPHLNRLPDELLPAICKFLIIARDRIENVILLVDLIFWFLLINFFFVFPE